MPRVVPADAATIRALGIGGSGSTYDIDSLAEDADVNLTALSDGEMLGWDGSFWTNVSQGTLEQNGDVSFDFPSTPAEGDVLYWRGGSWGKVSSPFTLQTMITFRISHVGSSSLATLSGGAIGFLPAHHLQFQVNMITPNMSNSTHVTISVGGPSATLNVPVGQSIASPQYAWVDFTSSTNVTALVAPVIGAVEIICMVF